MSIPCPTTLAFCINLTHREAKSPVCSRRMHAAELVDAALLHVNRTAGREEDFALAMLHFLPAGLPSQIRLSSWTFGVMAIIETHPETITGPWIEGFVLDRHVIKSVPIGYLGEHMQFDT